MIRPIGPDAALDRAKMLTALRAALESHGFVEVTTPVLLRVAADGPHPEFPFDIGGQTYDLRSSIELNLRTALVSLPRVYDIGPSVRFGDRTKGPRSAMEFSLMEFFAANLAYEDLISLSEDIVRRAAGVDLPELRRISVVAWFAKVHGIRFGSQCPADLRRDLEPIAGLGEGRRSCELIDAVVGAQLEPSLGGFVFLTDYPIETICLANRRADAPHVAERFEVFIDGLEIGHGFMDATEPDDVVARMQESGPQFTDLSFVNRLRSKELPPSGGFGLGIERLLLATHPDRSDVREFLHSYQHAATSP